jgi:hypothetical protein
MTDVKDKIVTEDQLEVQEMLKNQKKFRPEIIQVKLAPSKQKDSKYVVKIEGGKSVNFGQKGASDFTINKSQERQESYIARHKKREEQFWGAEQENLETASFWSRYLLWENTDIFEAIKEIEKKMGCEIKFTKNTIDKH